MIHPLTAQARFCQAGPAASPSLGRQTENIRLIADIKSLCLGSDSFLPVCVLSSFPIHPISISNFVRPTDTEYLQPFRAAEISIQESCFHDPPEACWWATGGAT